MIIYLSWSNSSDRLSHNKFDPGENGLLWVTAEEVLAFLFLFPSQRYIILSVQGIASFKRFFASSSSGNIFVYAKKWIKFSVWTSLSYWYIFTKGDPLYLKQHLILNHTSYCHKNIAQDKALHCILQNLFEMCLQSVFFICWHVCYTSVNSIGIQTWHFLINSSFRLFLALYAVWQRWWRYLFQSFAQANLFWWLLNVCHNLNWCWREKPDET